MAIGIMAQTQLGSSMSVQALKYVLPVLVNPIEADGRDWQKIELEIGLELTKKIIRTL
jgi:hypothetical protein